MGAGLKFYVYIEGILRKREMVNLGLFPSMRTTNRSFYIWGRYITIEKRRHSLLSCTTCWKRLRKIWLLGFSHGNWQDSHFRHYAVMSLSGHHVTQIINGKNTQSVSREIIDFGIPINVLGKRISFSSISVGSQSFDTNMSISRNRSFRKGSLKSFSLSCGANGKLGSVGSIDWFVWDFTSYQPVRVI